MQPPPVFAVGSPCSGIGAAGEEQSKEIPAPVVPGLSGDRRACPLAFPSPNPKGTAILTHHPCCQSDHHPGQRPPSGWTSPFTPPLSSGAVGSASPAGASQWRADEQRVLGTTLQAGLLAHRSHSSMAPLQLGEAGQTASLALGTWVQQEAVPPASHRGSSWAQVLYSSLSFKQRLHHSVK